jgi:hypothetical protein
MAMMIKATLIRTIAKGHQGAVTGRKASINPGLRQKYGWVESELLRWL